MPILMENVVMVKLCLWVFAIYFTLYFRRLQWFSSNYQYSGTKHFMLSNFSFEAQPIKVCVFRWYKRYSDYSMRKNKQVLRWVQHGNLWRGWVQCEYRELDGKLYYFRLSEYIIVVVEHVQSRPDLVVACWKLSEMHLLQIHWQLETFLCNRLVRSLFL